jgi:hypothetical protein
MRCYFVNDGHIAGVEMLPPGLSDKQAIERARLLSLKRKDPFDGFEVWHRNRCVFRQPDPSTRSPSYDVASASRRMTSL